MSFCPSFTVRKQYEELMTGSSASKAELETTRLGIEKSQI